MAPAPSPKRIQDAVRSIVLKKLNDGQFEECDVTMADLNAIQERICWIIRSMYHKRIKYPDQQPEISETQVVKNEDVPQATPNMETE